jgi:hypothetical protein
VQDVEDRLSGCPQFSGAGRQQPAPDY